MVNWTTAGLMMDIVGVATLGLVVPEYGVWRVGTASLGFTSRPGHALFIGAWALIVFGFAAQLVGALRPAQVAQEPSTIRAERVLLVRPDGSVAAELRDDSSGTTLTLLGPQGHRAAITPSELRFVDSTGSLRTSLGFRAERPFLALHDEAGDPRLLATLAPTSSVNVAYYAAKGTPLMLLSHTGSQFELTFWDSSGGAWRPLIQQAH